RSPRVYFAVRQDCVIYAEQLAQGTDPATPQQQGLAYAKKGVGLDHQLRLEPFEPGKPNRNALLGLQRLHCVWGGCRHRCLLRMRAAVFPNPSDFGKDSMGEVLDSERWGFEH